MASCVCGPIGRTLLQAAHTGGADMMTRRGAVSGSAEWRLISLFGGPFYTAFALDLRMRSCAARVAPTRGPRRLGECAQRAEFARSERRIGSHAASHTYTSTTSFGKWGRRQGRGGHNVKSRSRAILHRFLRACRAAPPRARPLVRLHPPFVSLASKQRRYVRPSALTCQSHGGILVVLAR